MVIINIIGSKVKAIIQGQKSGQTCLIKYRLYITSSTFVYVSIAEPVFIVL